MVEGVTVVMAGITAFRGDNGGMLQVVVVSSALTGGKYLPSFCCCKERGDLEKI